MKVKTENIEKSYEDIIHLSHHVSLKYPHMSIYDRAAQFSPFAALTGHSEAIKETARTTVMRIELDENEKQILDERFQILHKNISNHPSIHITFFIPDNKKVGGKYTIITGIVKKIDQYKHVIYLEDGMQIPIREIIEIEGEIF